MKLVSDKYREMVKLGKNEYLNCVRQILKRGVNLKDLKLSLQSNLQLKEKRSEFLTDVYQYWQNLESFSIYFGHSNELGPEGIRNMLGNIRKLKKLKHLEIIILSENKIGEKGCKEIGNILKDLK